MAIVDKMPPAPISGQGGSPMMQGSGAEPMPQQDNEGMSSDQGEPVSPQMQETYDKVVMQAVQDIDKNAKNIFNHLSNSPTDAAQEAGKFVAGMMIQMDESQGGAIPDEVIIPAAAEVGEQLAERLQAAGMDVDNSFIQRGTVSMMNTLGDHYGADEGELAEFLGSMPADKVMQYGKDEAAHFKGHESPIPGGGAAEAPMQEQSPMMQGPM